MAPTSIPIRHPRARNYKHGHAPLGASTVEYTAWLNMRNRCLCPSNKSFKDYGGRGIKVCDEWQVSFFAFLKHVGLKPSNEHSLERLNNDGNYEPGNVQWAMRIQQGSNKRNNRFLVFNGQRLTIPEWSRRLGIKRTTIIMRLYARGWSVEDALSTPVG